MQSLAARLGILVELLGFLWRRKLYWMIPMILTLAIFAGLIVLGNTSGLSPFVYVFF